jgi:hypothetical protein
MEISLSSIAEALRQQIESGDIYNMLLMVLGDQNAAGGSALPVGTDMRTFLDHIRALSKEDRRKFQGAFTFLHSSETWKPELKFVMESIDRPNETCIWCRQRLVEVHTLDTLKEQLDVFGFRKASGRKDEIAQKLVLLLPFCMALQYGVNRPAAASASDVTPVAVGAGVEQIADADIVARSSSASKRRIVSLQSDNVGRLGRGSAEGERGSGAGGTRRVVRARFTRTAHPNGAVTEESVLEQEDTIDLTSNDPNAGRPYDQQALATFFVQHYYEV